MSQLERASSENMYKEQAWVEKLLKRMRNEADNQAQNFHTFLVEQLLSVATSILAATSNQEKTVNTLSSKMDKHVRKIVRVYFVIYDPYFILLYLSNHPKFFTLIFYIID